jgi:hypothetical protein
MSQPCDPFGSALQVLWFIDSAIRLSSALPALHTVSYDNILLYATELKRPSRLQQHLPLDIHW